MANYISNKQRKSFKEVETFRDDKVHLVIFECLIGTEGKEVKNPFYVVGWKAPDSPGYTLVEERSYSLEAATKRIKKMQRELNDLRKKLD